MVGLSRSNIGRMAISGYPGHIFICKLRYGYGNQQHIEKLEILHNWFSDLRAYLPMLLRTKEGTTDPEYETKYAKWLNEVKDEIDAAYEMYDGSFEGQSCGSYEKNLIKAMRGIKERLDVITAESKIIEGIKPDEGQEMLAG